MRLLTSIDALSRLDGPVHLAIGVFDGVHRGHQAVLESAKTQAAQEDGVAVVATFDPHPAEVLAPDHAPQRLTGLAHLQHLFSKLGMDATLAIPFDRTMAAQSAEDFVQSLTESCALASMHVGEDWAFGKERQGNVELLREMGEEHGFTVHGIAPVLDEGERISSTAIRTAVSARDLDQAARLLGRPYSLHGPVAIGDQLGRQLGFPTANIDFSAKALPPYGVYAVRVLSHENLPGVANLGIRPSINGEMSLRFEVHLFDWEGDLYGQTMEVALLHHLRAEQRFESLTDLKGQIARDVSAARAWLKR